MEGFSKIVNGLKLLTVFAKYFILVSDRFLNKPLAMEKWTKSVK